MANYDEPLSYFDMDLKGVYKLNKTASLRLNLFINTLEKRQEQCMVKLDHDIRETKRKIASIEDEKNKLVMKLLKSYVRKTTQKNKKSKKVAHVQDSVNHSRSGYNTGFTLSTYLDVPGGSSTTSQFHPPLAHFKRPHSIPVRHVNEEEPVGSVRGTRTFSDFDFPARKHFSRNTNRQDIHSRMSKLSDIQQRDINSRSKDRDLKSRLSTRRDTRSRMSKISMVSELPATRGQLIGTANSDYHHNQRVKEMLGGNTCLFRGHTPARGYGIEPMHKKERGILPTEIHPDDYIKPKKLLDRIKIFGNVKLPNTIKRKFETEQLKVNNLSTLQPQRLRPTLPPILSNVEQGEKVENNTLD